MTSTQKVATTRGSRVYVHATAECVLSNNNGSKSIKSSISMSCGGGSGEGVCEGDRDHGAMSPSPSSSSRSRTPSPTNNNNNNNNNNTTTNTNNNNNTNNNTNTSSSFFPKQHWRPFPWNHVPDWVSFILGLCIILPISPLMALLIGAAELTWAVAWRTHAKLKLGFINRAVLYVAERVGNVVLRDKRDFTFLPYMLYLSTVTPFLFYTAWRYHVQHGFSWASCFLYHFLRIGPRFRFFAHQHVLLHKEGHDKYGLFKGPFVIFNYICQWFIGPFFGQVPTSYSKAHNKIHHRYDNGLEDAHTNLDLPRHVRSSLVIYTPRFFGYWSNITPLWFFIHKKEWKLARETALGMAYYYLLTAALMYVDWKFCLAFWVFPFMESVVFFCAISYLWHAFVDPEDPDNQYVNSVTILKGHDNIWNEDYHVVHHTAPTIHWTEYPAHYQKNIEHYKASRATIFQNTEEGEMLAWMLSYEWDKLAEHFVDLSGKMTHEEKKELLLTRLRATLSKAD